MTPPTVVNVHVNLDLSQVDAQLDVLEERLVRMNELADRLAASCVPVMHTEMLEVEILPPRWLCAIDHLVHAIQTRMRRGVS